MTPTSSNLTGISYIERPPGISGVDFARRIKHDPATRGIPVIMISAKRDEEDKVRALDTGADDYITKPFSTEELLARIRAVIRRSALVDVDREIVDIDRIRIDMRSHRVSIDQQNIGLSPTEFKLLHFLATHPERVHTRGQLLDGLWGNDAYVEERTVDVHIRQLRKLLEPHACDHIVQTVRGVGYRLSEVNPNKRVSAILNLPILALSRDDRSGLKIIRGRAVSYFCAVQGERSAVDRVSMSYEQLRDAQK